MEDKFKNISLQKEPIMEGELTGYPSIDKPSRKFYSDDMEERIFKDSDQKIYDFLRLRNFGFNDDIAYKYFGEEKTYGYLYDKIELCAKALKKYGISKGDSITICLPNMPETIFYIYACNRIGAIPYLVDPRCSNQRIIECMNISNSKLLISVMDVMNKSVFTKKIPSDKVVVVSPANDFLHSQEKLAIEAKTVKSLYQIKEKIYEFQNLLKKENKVIMQDDFIKNLEQYGKIVDSEYDPDIPALIVNTSGTTGTPKGAMQSNKAYNVTCNQINLIACLERGMTYLGYIPFFSMYGSSIGLCGALTNGISIDLLPKIKISEFDKIVTKRKPNILIAVPKMFSMFINSKYVNNTDMSFAKLMVAGGDNMAPEKINEVNQILRSKGCKTGITYGYGTTEAGNVSAFHYTGNVSDAITHKAGGCGALYPGVYALVMDRETNKELPYGQEGEIYVTSPTAFMGYIGNVEETTNSIYIDKNTNLRYYKTADKGFIDYDGILHITGRYKRLMKRPDGHQVSSVPIENAINDCEEVKDCAVVGIKNKYQEDGVIPTAFIELKNNDDVDAQIKTIIQKIKNVLPGEREMALAYTVVDKIPYTLGGKKDFIALTHNNFEDLKDFMIIDDPIFDGYFKEGENLKIISLKQKKYIKTK